MLKITQLNNVKNTLNSKITFKSGLQTNYGVDVPPPETNMVEGGLLTGFVGTIAPYLLKINSRAKSIEKGLNEAKLNYIA